MKRNKKARLVVKEHCLETTTKKWTTSTKGKKTPKRHSKQNILECTLELPELFTPDHTTNHAVIATMMKDTKSVTVKKALDEESKKLSVMGTDTEQRKASHKEEIKPARNPETSKVGTENYLKGEGCNQGPRTAEGTSTE